MSAIIVLILRIFLIISLYGFLFLCLVTLWRELEKTIKQQSSEYSPQIQLDIMDGRILKFSQPEISIGRRSGRDIQIDNETVSLDHARIFFTNNSWMVEDRNSTNGTKLNNEALDSPVVLVDGDQIKLGNYEIRVILRR